MDIKQNILLKDHTTFGIGGPADFFIEIAHEEEIEEAYNFAEQKNLPVFILGGGSNIVVHDEGFPGLVIANRIRGISSKDDNKRPRIEAGAGEIWDDLVAYATNHNWAGIECLSGIPGKVGAAPIQNIGAYGQDVASVIERVRVFDTRTKTFHELTNEECGFSYRKSIFNSSEKGRHIVTRLTLILNARGLPTLSYQDLKEKFPGPESVTLSEVRNAVIETRAKKGMVILPGYERYQSAGSFFKHPIISRDTLKEVIGKMKEKDAPHAHWYWPLPSGEVKLVAAHLIEHAGFERGHRRGNVGISPKHALALIHHGGGTARELIGLAREIQDAVKNAFGVTLAPEPEFVGFEEHPLI